MMWQIAILSGHRYLILFPVASLRGMDAGLSVSVYVCVCVYSSIEGSILVQSQHTCTHSIPLAMVGYEA